MSLDTAWGAEAGEVQIASPRGNPPSLPIPASKQSRLSLHGKGQTVSFPPKKRGLVEDGLLVDGR